MVDYAPSQALTTDLQVVTVGGEPPLSDGLTLTSSSSTTAALRAPKAENAKTALVWSNTATGATRLWVTDGTTQIGAADLSVPSWQGDPNWQVVSTNNYSESNRPDDGQADFLWRNKKTGEIRWWVTNGTGQPFAINLRTIEDLNWQIVGTADYDRDGTTDLLWRNATTGVNAWWLMDVSVHQQALNFRRFDIAPVRGEEWKIAGTADYNNDGQLDLLWRNTEDGKNYWWRTYDPTNPIQLPAAPTDWTIVGTGDYNRDGQVDLLWRNDTTGATAWWAMNGSQFQKSEWVTPTDSNLNWRIVGVNDNYVAAVTSVGPAPIPPNGNNDSTTTRNFQAQAANFTQQQALPNNTSDLYRFTVSTSGIFTANLASFIGDADVRLIQDDNRNGRLDSTDTIKAWLWERGSKAENIRSFISAGTYWVQVLVYNGSAPTYRLTTNFAAASTDSQKFSINIQYDISSLGTISDPLKQAIRNAANFWESVIPTRSAVTNFTDLTITIKGQSLNPSIFALTGPVFQTTDRTTVTILSAESTINTQRLDYFSLNLEYFQSIMAHEFAHALGFGTFWEPVTFNTGNGTSLRIGKNLIDRSTNNYNINDGLGNTTYASSSYGDLLGTFRPTAVPIEPGVFAHWDEARLGAELLTPFAEAVGVAMPASALTISALRDLGWNVNYGAVQTYQLPITSNLAAVSPTPTSTSRTNTLAALSMKCGCSGCLAGVRALPTLGETALGETALSSLV
jgi:FG-GAP-like repeat